MSGARITMLTLVWLALLCQLVVTVTIRSDCVERSLCYHSTDCCSGCCEDHQCVTGTTGVNCKDMDVPRNCSRLTCPQNEECVQEMRLCLIAPCPQPLPRCVHKKTPSLHEDEVPLPVQYN